MLSCVDAEPEAGEAGFVLVDQRGAPVLVQDAAGAVPWEARIAPYGSVVHGSVHWSWKASWHRKGTRVSLRMPPCRSS
jgi:hypothetical protein